MDSHKKSLFETKLPQPNPIINKDKQIDEKLKWKFIRTEKKQFWEGNGEADLVSIDEDETEIHF